ncbi:conjugal transfer protein TrbF [Pseudoxanthomonas putridarboris]|uniref:Conjugal transfer protein TrbF n=1 Tax=Pseudoxanthomonas putridarboris TaxID=752605 RepID=A0ABU9IV51_9GAMM
MRFRRAGLRYSETPQPATPYQKAGQVWDERIGGSSAQARDWRRMAYGGFAIAALAVGGLVWHLGRSTVVPYVVEVDTLGQVRAIGPALEAYRPTDAQIARELERFVRNVRSLPLDPVVLRSNWLEAYDYATDRGAAALNVYARENDPFARVGRVTVAVEVTSVVRASESSFQLRWIERSTVNGSPGGVERWTAIVTVVLQPPRDVVRLRKNPLGIYVNGLDWSRELGATAVGETP